MEASKVQACILSNVSNQVAEVHDEGDTESGIDITLRQATDLASDLIGKLNVVDLFSVTAIKILAAETGTEKFTAIIEATKSLSEYTHSFGNALYETPRNDFDLITHSILQIART
ncbi:hypothetical protein HPULCUR_009189 [Helicostylum pulchrum]|uniref:Uncharacterized protein n=1 Tax=Helicostylum pulchrum TaxID=562976 RepID=A0ABP9Y9T3_9FUNG